MQRTLYLLASQFAAGEWSSSVTTGIANDIVVTIYVGQQQFFSVQLNRFYFAWGNFAGLGDFFEFWLSQR